MWWHSPSAALLAGLIIGFSSAAPAATPTTEARLLNALHLLQADDANAAQRTLQGLLRQHPNFQLAHWLNDTTPALRCDGSDPEPAESDARGWLAEACLRLAAQAERPTQGWAPDALIRLTPRTQHVIAVDLSLARLYLFRVHGQHLTLLREHYIAMGREGFGKRDQGDLRTPLGIYRIEQWLDGRHLPPLYGAGALTLDYPNRWDHIRQRSGDGIWLHGVPSDTYVRAPQSSEGCITMANEDLLALRRDVRNGETLVLISDHLDWLDPNAFAQMRADFVERIENWKTQRTADDLTAYRQFYSANFDRNGQDIYSFMAHQRALSHDATPAQLKVQDLELLRTPDIDEGTLLRARFQLRSPEGVLHVEQIWRQEGSDWKILREDIERA